MKKYHNIIKVFVDLGYSVGAILTELLKRDSNITSEEIEAYISSNCLNDYKIDSARLVTRVISKG